MQHNVIVLKYRIEIKPKNLKPKKKKKKLNLKKELHIEEHVM